jgi:ADP-ribosyl-[dinitrogen reductase] hydrolase
MYPLTSQSHPLRIDSLDLPPANGGGRIGMTFCPGKKDPHSMSGPWLRDLDLDLDAIRDWGATAHVCLLEDHELDLLSVAGLPDGVQRRGIAWLHLPIRDVDIPDVRFETRWPEAGAGLRARLRNGEAVLVHCRGGLGRTGMVVCRLLIELGQTPARALASVRAVRPGAVETSRQERYVLGLGAGG